jgi:cytochrome c-type biogenesis protein CcmH
MRKMVVLAATLLALAGPALAVDPAEMLKDPKQEARAEKLGAGLRCMVCQSESIEESNADLARDLRVIVRQRIVAGESDDQIVDYLHSRYGDYVLLDPPFKAKTLVLWLGPFALLLAAGAAGAAVLRRRAAAPPPPALTAEEMRRLDALLKDAGKS